MLDIATIRKYEDLGWNYTPYHHLPNIESGNYGNSGFVRVLCLDLMPMVYTGQYNASGDWILQGIDETDGDRIYLSPHSFTLKTEDIDFWRYLSADEINNLFIQYRRG